MIRACAALAAILVFTGCSEAGDVVDENSAYSTDGEGETLARTPVESALDAQRIKELQAKLCVAETGRFDADTRVAIRKMYDALFAHSTNRSYDGREDIAEERFLETIRAEPDGCGDFKGAFEKYYFRALPVYPPDPLPWEERLKQRIRRFQDGLGRCVASMENITGKIFDPEPTDEDSFVTGVFDARTRDGIAYVLSVVENIDTQASMARRPAALGHAELESIDVRSIDNCGAHERFFE